MRTIADSSADCTIADLAARIQELETVRLKAMEAGQFEAALAAIKEIGVLAGVRPKERKVVILGARASAYPQKLAASPSE